MIGTNETRTNIIVEIGKGRSGVHYQVLKKEVLIISDNMKWEIKTRIINTIEVLRRKEDLFCWPINKKLKRRLNKCFVWSIYYVV